MTINVCLVTHEAIVFGCDSVASRSAYFVDAFEFLKRDNGGEWAKTQDGKLIAEFDISKAKNLVTSAWGGVTKMLQVHGNPCPVAAVTAGLANLSNRNMATLAAEFAAQHDDNPLSTVEEVATAFLQFFREQFDLHYKDSQIPDDFKEGPLFMLGGFASNDLFPSLYKIDVKNNRFDLKCGGGASNIFWEG